MKRAVVTAMVVAVGLSALPAFVAPGYSAARVVVDALGVATPVAVIVFMLLSIPDGKRARPVGFVVRVGTPSFAVPATRKYGFVVLGWLALVTMMAGHVVDLWAHPGEQPGYIVLRLLGTASTLLWVVLGVPVVRPVLGGRPTVELTPSGVVVRDPLRRRTFPWEALRPGTPVRGYGSVELVVDRPELVRRQRFLWRWRRISLTYADVHPWFFADAVRFYVDHPARRPYIGTPEEFTRLLIEFGVLVPLS